MRQRRGKSTVDPKVAAEVSHRLALRLNEPRAHSIRAISRELRINRDTVRAIERGHYSAELPGFHRCSTCGHRVLLPCLICQARQAAAP